MLLAKSYWDVADVVLCMLSVILVPAVEFAYDTIRYPLLLAGSYELGCSGRCTLHVL